MRTLTTRQITTDTDDFQGQIISPRRTATVLFALLKYALAILDVMQSLHSQHAWITQSFRVLRGQSSVRSFRME